MQIKIKDPESGRRPIVTYWPSTVPSIKRCTCVNKRKKSGSKCALNNNITSTQTAWVSWRQDAEAKASGRGRALGPQWPTVKQPQPRWERSAAVVRRTLGQYSSLFLSPTHLSHTRNIKCKGLYFYKEVCSFIIIVDYVSTYICLCIRRSYCGYTILFWVMTRLSVNIKYGWRKGHTKYQSPKDKELKLLTGIFCLSWFTIKWTFQVKVLAWNLLRL